MREKANGPYRSQMPCDKNIGFAEQFGCICSSHVKGDKRYQIFLHLIHFVGKAEHFVTFIMTFTSSTPPGSKESVLDCVWSPFESEYFSPSFM